MNTPFIDDVARRMTDVAPPADLRARVVAQLPERPAPWRAWVPAIAAAAVAVVAAGVIVSRPAPPRDAAQLAAASSSSPTQTLARQDAVTGPAGAPATSTPVRAKRTSPKLEAISAAEAAWRARAIPAIAAAPALTADGIQPQTLSVPLLELKPLVNLPVIVAPIGADASGGR